MADKNPPEDPSAVPTGSSQAEGETPPQTTENTSTSPDPDAVIERPKDAPHTRWVAHEVTRDVYEAMVADYIAGTCVSKSAIQRKYHIAWDTAQKAVDRGWPHRGWAGLKQRKMLHEEVTKKAAIVAKAQEQQSFKEAMREHTGVLRSTLSMCARLVKGLFEVADGAKWVKSRRRRTYDASGAPSGWEEHDAPLTGPELSLAAARLAVAMRDISSTLLTWHDKDHTIFNTPADPDAAARGWMALTPEQIDFIIKNEGELPPGVTSEMLLGASPSNGVKSN